VKILILGAGGIGGYLGGRLQQGGADVTFLVRPARQQALHRDGLVIKSTKGDVTLKVKTLLKGGEGGPYDLVMLSNKAYDLDSALEAVTPAVGANTVVMPLLNGMRHIDILQKRFGAERVAGGVARIGVALSDTGHVLHTSPFAGFTFGELSKGKAPRPALVALDAAVKKAGVDGGLHPDIAQDLWDKWVFLCAFAAMCCLLRGTSGDMMEATEGEAILTEAAGECAKVAAAAGHASSQSGVVGLGNMTQRGSRFAASMLHDLEKGAMVEADHVVGDMIERAKKAGIATPILRLAYAHLQVYLARRARGGLGAGAR
jgi:2-dehydropantoate 2-reductase